MSDRNIMQQALEALLEVNYDQAYAKEVAVLRERLAQPEQEPVLETVYETIIQWDEGGGKRSRRELARRIVALYTTPPQRKPLTDEEIEDLYFDKFSMGELKAFARAIEAAHGIGEQT